jgi:hypothetical protein
VSSASRDPAAPSRRGSPPLPRGRDARDRGPGVRLAASPKAGRLLDRNPFANLGLSKPKGNVGVLPPSQDEMEALITHARDLTPPSFAAYLEFACVTGARPGGLDAPRWSCVRLDADEADLVEQWNAKPRTFTDPKYGAYSIALTGRAREVLLRMKRDSTGSPFVFSTLRGSHYTPSSRIHHWEPGTGRRRPRAHDPVPGHAPLLRLVRHQCA